MAIEEEDNPSPVTTHRRLGSAKGDFIVPEDFDEALSPEILDEFEKSDVNLSWLSGNRR